MNLALIIVVIVVDLIIASGFSDIASKKGHNGAPYFWWCFLFSLPGWLMVVALPDKSNSKPVVSDELPDL